LGYVVPGQPERPVHGEIVLPDIAAEVRRIIRVHGYAQATLQQPLEVVVLNTVEHP